MGSGTDVLIVNMDRGEEMRDADRHAKRKITPFEGAKVRGRAVCAIVRARVVIRDGEPGWGRPAVPAARAVPA